MQICSISDVGEELFMLADLVEKEGIRQEWKHVCHLLESCFLVFWFYTSCCYLTATSERNPTTENEKGSEDNSNKGLSSHLISFPYFCSLLKHLSLKVVMDQDEDDANIETKKGYYVGFGTYLKC